MPKQVGPDANVLRELVDLAQSDLTAHAFLQEVIGLLDQTLGFDTAFAVGPATGGRMMAYNAPPEHVEVAERTLRYSKTRYAADILPVFATTDRVGGCIDTEFFPTERSRQKSVLFQEVMKPTGVRSMLQLCARWRGRPMVRLNLNRHGGQRFSASDLERGLGLLPTLEACLAARAASETTDEISGLTRREMEVAELVARGLTTAQVGSVLGTSAFTVRNQLTRIFDKLGVDSRAELAAFVAARRPSVPKRA